MLGWDWNTYAKHAGIHKGRDPDFQTPLILGESLDLSDSEESQFVGAFSDGLWAKSEPIRLKMHRQTVILLSPTDPTTRRVLEAFENLGRTVQKPVAGAILGTLHLKNFGLL
jgi:hypothetical protein